MALTDEEIAIKIEIEAERAQMSLGDLEKGFDHLQTKLKATNRGTEEGRKEFKKLASQMAQTSKEIKNIELSFEGLDREQVASEIGSVAGAVGDLSASLIILSGDNETLEATAHNIEKAMMVSMGLKGAIEGLSSARKLYNNLLRQANDDEKEGIALTVLKTAKEKVAAVGTFVLNAANKALNTTMKMNPIGLVVIALTAVVGAIIYFKDAIWSLIKTALEPFQFIIDILIDGLQAMGIMASDEAIAQEKAAEKKIESYRKQAKELEKLREAHERLSKKVLGDLEYELELLKAKGEDTADAEWAIVNQKKKAALEAKRIAIDEYKNSQKLLDLRKAQNKEITNEDIEAHNKLVDNLKAAGAAYIEAKREQTIFFANRKRERKEEREKEAAEDDKAAKEASKRRKAQREKDKAAREKAAADQKKIDEKAAADAIQLEKEKNQLLEDLEAKAIEDKTTRSLAELEIAQERERQQLIEKYGEDTELMLALEEEQLLQMNTLIDGIEQEARDKEQEARDKKAEADKLARDKELENIEAVKQAKIEAAQQSMDLALTTLNAISEVSNAYADRDLKAEEDRFNNLRATKQLTEKQIAAEEAKSAKIKDDIRKRQFENDKKMQIAMAAINGAQALTSIFAQYPKFDGGFAMIAALASSVITTAATIAKIKATTFQSTPAPALPAIDSGDGGAAGASTAAGGAAITPVSNTSTILGGQKVFVTETDITETQNNVSVIEESATF